VEADEVSRPLGIRQMFAAFLAWALESGSAQRRIGLALCLMSVLIACALLFSGCAEIDAHNLRFDREDVYCRGIDDHNTESPERQPTVVSCGWDIHFDSPIGHKLEGEK
jgi:hypothetical protein